MNIFVTGGTGNIGQYVTLALLERGHSVKLLTRTPERIPAFSAMNGVTLVKGTLLDFNVIENALSDCDGVIHIALGWGNTPVDMIDNDTRATAFLLEASERAGVKNFIYTSSTAATGPLRNGMDETALRIPTDLYGSTKASAELYALGFRQFYSNQGVYGEKVNLRRNVIRPGYTFSNPAVEGGASQSDKRFAMIADAVVNNRDLSFSKNDGTQFLSSRQIAQLYVKLIESELNEEIFFALGRRFVSWYEIACMAKELVPESTSNIIATDEEGEHNYYCVDKMEKMFGLSFDGGDDLKEHMAWNIERAKAVKQGLEIHDTLHECCR